MKTLKFLENFSDLFEPIPNGNFLLLLHFKIPILVFFAAPYCVCSESYAEAMLSSLWLVYPIAMCSIVTLSSPHLSINMTILTESLPAISPKVFTRQRHNSVPMSVVITLYVCYNVINTRVSRWQRAAVNTPAFAYKQTCKHRFSWAHVYAAIQTLTRHCPQAGVFIRLRYVALRHCHQGCDLTQGFERCLVTLHPNRSHLSDESVHMAVWRQRQAIGVALS